MMHSPLFLGWYFSGDFLCGNIKFSIKTGCSFPPVLFKKHKNGKCNILCAIYRKKEIYSTNQNPTRKKSIVRMLWKCFLSFWQREWNANNLDQDQIQVHYGDSERTIPSDDNWSWSFRHCPFVLGSLKHIIDDLKIFGRGLAPSCKMLRNIPKFEEPVASSSGVCSKTCIQCSDVSCSLSWKRF